MDALPPTTPPAIAACIQQASERYAVPRQLIYAVAAAEGGYPGAKVRNKNGTYDLGRMQINTSNLPELARYGITKQGLAHDECLNINIGAWKLATNLQRENGDWHRAIARYNVGSLNTPGRIATGQKYAAKVVAYWLALAAEYSTPQ